MPSLDRWLLIPESPVFCSLTFAPLTSNAPPQLFLSLLLLAASMPCKSLSHQGPDWCCSGQGCKVSYWETDCISEGEISDSLWFAQSSISFCLCSAKRWCVYHTDIPTCSDAAQGNHLSLWHFFGQTHTCKLCLIHLRGPYQLIKIL